MTATMTAPNLDGLARRAKLPAWKNAHGYRNGWRGDETYTHKIAAPASATVRLATMAEAVAAGWGRNWKCSDGITT